jgi:N-acetylgalactosamine kinase
MHKTISLSPSKWIDVLKSQRYINLLRHFLKIFENDNPVYILRVPARINLKGVHIEHQGGYVNYMTIDKEAVFVVQKRDDDQVCVANTDNKYNQQQFSIRHELPIEKRGDWLDYVKNIKIQQGDWINYIKAGVLVIQNHFQDQDLSGMNILIDSNIPVGSGLSSSSSIVVGSVLSMLQINELEVNDSDLVELCGIGEWYVGTRGGAGDHSAMLFCKKGKILHTRFFPFHYDLVPFPEDYRIIVCNSFVKAVKSKGARNVFNEKVSTYKIATMLIAELHPEKSKSFTHLRDIIKEEPSWIYTMLKSLPARISRKGLLNLLPSWSNELENIFQTHDEPPAGYEVRNVCLFGLSECSRGERCIEYIKKREMEKFGEFMYLSHNGDRIVSFDEKGIPHRWNNEVTDEYLVKLINLSLKKDPQSRLFLQSGRYGCSCEELDLLVDISRSSSLSIGAGLTGAGLGGCVLVLIKEKFIESFLTILEEKYYKPRGLTEGYDICSPGNGASFITPQN